ncbi:hypothetical protein QEH59_17030 [Coraliomargarita sp. SDUM461004]|uniref:Uncharacterized protein n=1 Tax=Thalassobacterium sedimentorum TaxID=3041258 RepID=A0ABU1AMX5_9BACT|nr:hypothetical protein [Coraliomargarita sp. SDUM461004]
MNDSYNLAPTVLIEQTTIRINGILLLANMTGSPLQVAFSGCLLPDLILSRISTSTRISYKLAV